ncbi:MFS transporter [Pleurocapsa sp. FMAR1]|uniref:MFS transporter n=1 Tax=Pleurocapsa sp. FMAR1 TaxID=3040204 RepID=UPI0029C8707F|nr:MFS transporter [Pleurocapsa sp. FMAR1]
MKRHNPDSFLIKATLLLISTLTVMAGAAIAPSLPAMEKHFADVENAEYLVKLALTIPALFIALFSFIVGMSINRIGRKRLLLFSTLLFACAGSAGFILNSLWAIILSRALLGMSAAGTMTGVMTIISDYYPGQKRASFMGLQAAAMGLGGMVFAAVGGISADFNWRFPFLIYILAFFVFILTAIALYEPEEDKHENNKKLAFVLPKESIGIIYGLGLIYMVAYYLIFVQLPFYLLEISNASAAQSGIALAVSTLAGAIASSQYGAIKKRLDFSIIIIIAFALTAVGQFIMGFGDSYRVELCGLIIAGVGFGLVMPNFSNWLATIVPNHFRGRVLGGLTTFLFLGQFISPIISQPIVNVVGFSNTYSLSAILLLQLAITLLVVKISTAFIAEKI